MNTNGLGKRLRELMAGLDHNNIKALNEAGKEARALMLDTPLPQEVNDAISMGIANSAHAWDGRRKLPFVLQPPQKIFPMRLSPDSRTQF